ncbi:non-ribosomal peptide synthetase [Xenorhabdus hominickii]|uniref:Non-ribosomal peptide synthetase n=1 Tax=Xenorhabdus hominickii TaxID=351679 RepID=A0A2G0PYF0_XENHO|nr:non-ribosomal peptide synthetase [Xenorhabdus hominickii]AOM39965.1 non-ribosomal peptide synthetase [Xenorhabdus hominickii]PHM51999.1 yersiniabactin non-ribosomal peptide synthetase [Xenorhabdus hominickii]PHM52959.1 yersiniabactin non-ribosomal peptide synthetase [Xenorhabdus hominickii]PHM53753.1 yersiniabactin non-ribosomal peptide synthetase [Xenorhabdus hominickii]
MHMDLLSPDSLRQLISGLFNQKNILVGDDDDLIRNGLDSMQIMALLNQFRRQGHRVTLRELYQEPTLHAWSQLLQCNTPQCHAPVTQTVSQDTTPQPRIADACPFPLTAVQHAYFVGRSPEQTLGGIGCHLYQEFDGIGLKPEQLETAIHVLIQRHPMLRVRFLPDGRQQGMTHAYWKKLTVHDLRSLTENEQQRALSNIREQLSHRVLQVDEGETFDIQLSLFGDNQHRLHTNIDLLIMDAASFSLFFTELAAVIAKRSLPAISSDYDFCSYLTQYQGQFGQARQDAEVFWRSRLDTLPLAPQLPLARDPALIKDVRIQRRRFCLAPEHWERFKHLAQQNGVTPTMALATAFAALLCRWSNSTRLLFNLTLFDRASLHPAVDNILADFTNILLLDIPGDNLPFCQLAKDAQATFAEAYEHRHWSGVEVLRELKKRGNHPHGAPIVFTSNLGRPLYGENTRDVLGKPSWGISQTPQVWLDFVAFEHENALNIQWDSNDELFPDGLMDTLFTAYQGLIENLTENATQWSEKLPDLMPESQYHLRHQINNTVEPLPDALLHEDVFAQAERTPNAVALVTHNQKMSYGELSLAARQLAAVLQEMSVMPGGRVAISMEKGIGQIVAVLAILYAGSVYVPVPVDQPLSRRRAICESAGINIVITDPAQQNTVWSQDVHCVSWHQDKQVSPLASMAKREVTDPAYIIYTSGSTGIPKGVVISHQSALNTCLDINRRHQVQSSDRLLALSALHFDLSVYDIFGILSTGGALVLINEAQRRDPSTWEMLIEQHNITLWNSVPALFDMLLTYCEGIEVDAPKTLRTVMLSGDWVGLSLPERYQAFNPDGVLSAMGGATEAAIWSNEYIVKKVDAQWRSIPYGYPLANQRYRIVGEDGRDCPDWVVGELWIGGVGVALGYFNDEERTAAQFVVDQGERWYRTGDLGCYHPEGWLEFVGRRDSQVKIGGYRIELGEIDAALNQVTGISKGVALTSGEKDKSLVAFLELEGDVLCQRVNRAPQLPTNYRELFPAMQAITNKTSQPDDSREFQVAIFLLEHLSRYGITFTSPQSLTDCLKHYQPQPEYHDWFARMLAYLCQCNPLECSLLVESAHHIYQAGLSSSILSQALNNEAGYIPERWHSTLRNILTGQQTAVTLLDDPQFAPEQQLFVLPETQQWLAGLKQVIIALSQRLQRPVTVMEFDARSGLCAQWLAEHITDQHLSYIGFERSQAMINQMQTRLSNHAHASIKHWPEQIPESLQHQADIILLNNVLHRETDPANCIKALMPLAQPGALVLAVELHHASSISLITTELLSPHGIQLRSASQWLSLLPLQTDTPITFGSLSLLLMQVSDSVTIPDREKIKSVLAQYLPGYMIPQRLHVIPRLPLTPNGKIDRKALAQGLLFSAKTETETNQSDVLLLNAEEQAVAVIWQRLLNTAQPDRNSDFFQLGGDSLLATRLIGELAQQGLKGELSHLFRHPQLATFTATLSPLLDPLSEISSSKEQDKDEYQPFPLTEVQQAYLVGRHPGFTLSGVGAHFFIEYRIEQLDVQRLNRVLNRLILRHPVLRTIVINGQQQILKNVPLFSVKQHQFAVLSEADTLRDRLSHQVLDVSHWPVFDFQLAQDNNLVSRLFVSLDNLLLDGLSMQILLAELEQLYLDEQHELPPLNVTFRDCVLRQQQTPTHQNSLQYWQEQVKTLPLAPQLPLRIAPESVQSPRFVRYSDRLSAHEWNQLKQHAAPHQITPSALLIAAYAAVLSAFSTKPELTLNLTLFDRPHWHEDIKHILGDFTSLSLLAWHPEKNWLSSTRRLQQQLWQDLDHRHISAIKVMRELAQSRGPDAAIMPVVFTSALGTHEGKFLSHSSWMKPVWGISQTPQIWLDHQVYESDNELCLNWDAVEELFEPHQLQNMFNSYMALLRTLAAQPESWHSALEQLIPRQQCLMIEDNTVEDNATVAIASSPRLEGFDLQVRHEICSETCSEIQRLFLSVINQPINAQQNFFEAGANSLQLIQLHSQLQHAGFQHLSVTDLFAYPTPETLSLRCRKDTQDENCQSITLRQRQQQKRLQQREKRHKGAAQ